MDRCSIYSDTVKLSQYLRFYIYPSIYNPTLNWLKVTRVADASGGNEFPWLGHGCLGVS